MMSHKENFLRAIRHQAPAWVPHGMEAVTYISAPSHGVPYDQELIDAMNDEIKTHGRSVYQTKTA